jgi:hypothetical protein
MGAVRGERGGGSREEWRGESGESRERVGEESMGASRNGSRDESRIESI